MSVLTHRPLIDWIPLLGLPVLWLVSFVVFYARNVAPASLSESGRGQRLAHVVTDYCTWMVGLVNRLATAVGLTRGAQSLVAFALFIAAAAALGQGAFGLGGWLLLGALFTSSNEGSFGRAVSEDRRVSEFLGSSLACFGDLVIHVGYLYYYRNHGLAPLLIMASLIGSTVAMYIAAKVRIHGFHLSEVHLPLLRTLLLGCGAALAPLLSVYLEPDAVHPGYPLALLAIGVMAVLTNVTAIRQIRYIMRTLKSTAPSHGATP